MKHEAIMAQLPVGTRLNFHSSFLKPQGVYEITKIGPNGQVPECIWLQKVGKSGKLLKPVGFKTLFCYESYDITSAVRCAMRGDNQGAVPLDKEGNITTITESKE